MIKKIILPFYLLLFVSNGNIFAQMIELPFSEKVQNSSLIFEGKVISKKSFWNAQHSLIFTANEIAVYKVFKGDTSVRTIEIITQGGQADNEIQTSSHSLDLTEGDVGVFFSEASPTLYPQTKNAAFRTYGDMQGFIKYDLIEKTATDPFKKYENIREDIYKPIVRESGQAIKEIQPFSLTSDALPVQKEKKCCMFKHCRKKDK